MHGRLGPEHGRAEAVAQDAGQHGDHGRDVVVGALAQLDQQVGHQAAGHEAHGVGTLGTATGHERAEVALEQGLVQRPHLAHQVLDAALARQLLPVQERQEQREQVGLAPEHLDQRLEQAREGLEGVVHVADLGR